MSTNADASLTLVRNATVLATVGETTFLVDPLFAPQGALPPIDDTPNDRANPLVPMPDVDRSHDAVIVTHRHPDHFDDAAKAELDPDVPLFCQPTEADAFVDEGFTDVRPVEDAASFAGSPSTGRPAVTATGTGRADGTGLRVRPRRRRDAVPRRRHGLVRAGRGDTGPVRARRGRPQRRRGAVQRGEPITMGVDDDVAAVREATDAAIAVVHMEAINHCLLSREELRSETEDVLVPEDGEEIEL